MTADFQYLIQNFFTNKDYLLPAEQLPGTLFTPLHFAFSGCVLLLVILSAVYVGRRKKLVRPVFTALWAALIVLEPIVVIWESMSGEHRALDLVNNLSLYPCSLFMYVMPFAIWGKGIWKRMACGYVCTLGLLGAAVNFFYPAVRLASYSCISFAGFHTFFYHGTMLFTCLVMLISGYCSYHTEHWWELFVPCIPSLLLSVPANIVNYSPVHSDYMFFRGQLPVVAAVFGNARDITVTLVLYLLYILVPALFFLPSFVSGKKQDLTAFLTRIF